MVGGGPTGLMAAVAAGRAGARVILVAEQAELGGRLLYRSHLIGGTHPHKWLKGILAELKTLPEMQLLTRSTVTGYYDHNFLIINEWYKFLHAINLRS